MNKLSKFFGVGLFTLPISAIHMDGQLVERVNEIGPSSEETMRFVEKLINALTEDDDFEKDIRGSHAEARTALTQRAEEMATKNIYITDPQELLPDDINEASVQEGPTCWAHAGAKVVRGWIVGQFKSPISIRNLLPHSKDIQTTLVNLVVQAKATNTGDANFCLFIAIVGPDLGALLTIFAHDDKQRKVGLDWMRNQGLFTLVRKFYDRDLAGAIGGDYQPPYFLGENFLQGGERLDHATVVFKNINGSEFIGLNSWGEEQSGPWASRPVDKNNADCSHQFKVDLSPDGFKFDGDVKLNDRTLELLAPIDPVARAGIRQEKWREPVGKMAGIIDADKRMVLLNLYQFPNVFQRVCHRLRFDEGTNIQDSSGNGVLHFLSRTETNFGVPKKPDFIFEDLNHKTQTLDMFQFYVNFCGVTLDLEAQTKLITTRHHMIKKSSEIAAHNNVFQKFLWFILCFVYLLYMYLSII